jgi:hypothetical protein
MLGLSCRGPAAAAVRRGKRAIIIEAIGHNAVAKRHGRLIIDGVRGKNRTGT